MKRILLSLLSIGAVAVLAVFATQAFFSDTETSEGNVLQAGALDLKIDNTCYYNGLACTPALGENDEPLGYSTWGGDPEAEHCACTWELSDLDEKHVLFDFADLKPGDWEEDTLSIHVDNDSWMCVDIDTTANDDVTCTEPELEDDGDCAVPGAGLGELADELYFVFWLDDGDNVFEADEVGDILSEGLASSVLDDAQWALADADTGKPIPGAGEGKVSAYIGKFFCFGNVTKEPVAADQGQNPTVDSGFDCDGELVDNASQTDLLSGKIVFYAEQHRNNPNFLCNEREP